MAAPTSEHNKCNNMDVCKPRLINDNNYDTRSASEDGSCVDHVGEMVEREIGEDLKSLRKVKGLLEKLTAENKVLEEQVKPNTVLL